MWPSCRLLPAVVSGLLMMLNGVHGTAQPTTLGAAVSANAALQVEQHNQLNELHLMQDGWTRAKDSNTLLHYAIRNTQNHLLATSNARLYHADVRQRLNERNTQLFNWNVALNNSVQMNEFIIENLVNQSHRKLNDETEALDAQNVALLAEIGAKRADWIAGQTRYSQANEPRTFGLSLARQESVHRKLAEEITWEKVEEISLAHRDSKEHFAGTSHALWGQKNDLDVRNDYLETQVPTLKFQRDLQETLKLQETYKKKSEALRHANYKAQVPALESTRNSLLTTLKRLRIDNQKLREHKNHLEEERATLQQDLLIQKTGEINSLLEFNANEEYHQKMKTLFNQKKNARDAASIAPDPQNGALTKEHESIVCQEHVRELSKDNAYLQHQINVLNEHCTGF